jgi:hypothetical protein
LVHHQRASPPHDDEKEQTMAVRREMVITAAAVAAAGVLVAGVTAVSNASTTGQVAHTGYSVPGYQGGEGGQDGQGRGMGGHTHTAVTGTELEKVKTAVKAKDSTITVQSVRKDPDGSYDVMGTKGGNPVMVEVSKDLKTIEVRTGGPGGKGHGMGDHTHTPVTGTELEKVKTAVKAKDSTITVQSVRKDPDGSYDVMGTKGGNPVMVEVSKDLKTIEVRTGGPGDMGHRTGGFPDSSDGQQQAPSTSSSNTSTTSTI